MLSRIIRANKKMGRDAITHWVFDSLEEYYAKYNTVYEGEIPRVQTDWKSIEVKEGDWVVADDDRVVQILKKKDYLRHPKDTTNYTKSSGYVRTCVGAFLCSTGTYMDADLSVERSRYTFSPKPVMQIRKEHKDSLALSSKDEVFMARLAGGVDPLEAYKSAFKNDGEHSEKNMIALLKTKRIRNKISEVFRQELVNQGMTEEYIAGKYKTLAEDEDSKIQLEAIRDVRKMHQESAKEEEESTLIYFKGFNQVESKEIEDRFGSGIGDNKIELLEAEEVDDSNGKV